jgi:hypothetical protein
MNVYFWLKNKVLMETVLKPFPNCFHFKILKIIFPQFHFKNSDFQETATAQLFPNRFLEKNRFTIILMKPAQSKRI